MPPVVRIIAGIALVGLAILLGPLTSLAIFGYGFTAAGAAFYGAIGASLALGGIGSLLRPKLNLGGPGLSGREITVMQSAAPWQIVYGLRRIHGAWMPVTMAGANNEFFYFIIVWCYGGPDGIEDITTIYFGDEVAVNGTTPVAKYTGLITVEHHLGTDAQTASSLLTTDVPAAWTSTDRLRGHAYTVFKLKYNADKFSDFSIQGIRAQVKGRKVLDPRTGVIAYSTNPILQARDFASNARFGMGFPTTDFDDAENNASANFCDELVSVKAGGTRLRYASHAAFMSNEQPGKILLEFMATVAGQFNYSGGKWQLRAGTWRPPALALDDDDLRGPLEMTATLGRKDLQNGVKGQFTETTHWEATNYPVVAPAKYLTEDGDIRLWGEVNFSFVTDAGQAQQLALIALRRVRSQKRITLPLKMLAYELVPGDTFLFTHTAFAGRETWVEKPFVVEVIELVVGEDGTMGVNVTAREETAEVYGWNPTVDETTFAAPPAPTLPSAAPSPFVAPNSDPTQRPGVLGVMTYRPTTNPLSAADVGATATLSVAAFTQRVQGFGDVSVSSGSITALTFGTLYFIYYDDLSFAGGSVTFVATTTKETAINGAGRFFIGSIRMPVDGGTGTVGNGDGGVGAQLGSADLSRPTAFAEVGPGSTTNPTNAYDNNTGTYSEAADQQAIDLAVQTVYKTFPVVPVSNRGTTTLKITSQVIKGGTGTIEGRLRYSVDGGATWTLVYDVSVSRAETTDSVYPPPVLDVAQIQVEVLSDWVSGASATVALRVKEIWLETIS